MSRPAPRFNEAAGIPRGRLSKGRVSIARSFSFNEAAGIPRGRPILMRRVGAVSNVLQ